jgi:hypothetical protein
MALKDMQPDPLALSFISPTDAWAHELLPLFSSGGSLWLAMAEPAKQLSETKLIIFDNIQFTYGYNSVPVTVPREDLLLAIEKYFGPQPHVN